MGDYGHNARQEGDVLMVHGSEDRGDIVEDGGFIVMTEFYETMAYLTLFGGNERDDGSQSAEKLQWCGNEGEPPERQYRGRFQSVINGGPLTSASLLDAQKAAQEDLEAAFLPTYAESITVAAVIPSPKRIDIEISITTLQGETRKITVGAYV